MIKTIPTISAILLMTILLTGAISPYSFATNYDDNDDDHDDCDDKHYNHDDDYSSNHHDRDDCEPDSCDCKKPTEFTVRYYGPGNVDNPAVVEIYKKTNHIGEKDPIVPGREVYVNVDPESDSNQILVTASDFGKKKLGSNVGYRILWDDPQDAEGLTEIARIDIHTSCSETLYIGQTFTDVENIVTLTVEDGTKKGKTSIPISDPNTCEEEPPQVAKAIIVLKSAVTTDNNVDLVEFTPRIDGIQQEFDVPIEIDAGVPHIISEDAVDNFSPVLIAGDTECPAMLDENFVLKKDQTIVCTIYHDDNFQESSNQAGVIFHFDTQIFEATSDGFQDLTVGAPCTDFTDPLAPVSNNVDGKCVEKNGSTITVVPDLSEISQELTDTTIVVFTVIPVDADTNSVNADFTSDCIFTGLGSSVNDDNLGFKLFCSVMSNNNAGDGVQYNVNYALIETSMG